MLRLLVLSLAVALAGCAVGTASPGDPEVDGGAAATGTGSCDGWAGPSTASGCRACSSSSASCQPNGCYGGYWCETSTMKCHSAPPPGC